MPAITRILARRGTSSAWSAANPVLGAGEMGWDTTALKFKMGDGVAAWNALAYAIDAELALKANTASPTFTGTVTGVTASMVGLGSVNNTADSAKPVSTAQQTALNLKANLASPAFTGTPTGITAAHVGLGSVNNTADTAKPVSTAQQTALNLKANLASPAFTGTPTGITKAHVGLGSVDNTTDAAKPVSTAQQTALNGKANTVHTHPFGDIVATEMGAGVDLDSVTPGDYFQSQSVEATTALHYPLGVAGFLQARSLGGMSYQTYFTYGNNSRQFWRTRYTTTWYPWIEVLKTVDNNILGTAENPVTNASAARPTGLTSVWWLTATKPVNSASGDIWMVAP